MSGVVSWAERGAADRSSALRLWLELEGARARAADAHEYLLFASVAEFVLSRGRAFESAPLGDAERRSARRIGRWCRAEHGGFRFGQPFWNARQGLMLDVLNQFQYVEGFVLDEGRAVPRPHAWLCVNGIVVDFTGPFARGGRAGKYPPTVFGDFSGRSYFGVELPRDFVCSQHQTLPTLESPPR
jgi:hypothetical protein